MPFRSFAFALVLSITIHGAPSTASDPKSGTSFVPAQLRPWIPWVMESLGDSACPGDDDDSRLCVAMSRLEVRADKTGADFVLTGRRFSRGEVELPGDSTSWPVEVKDGAVRIPVIGTPSSTPFVERPTGPFRIAGRLKWRKRPSSLTLPADIAVMDLVVDGKIASWDPEENRMWLEERATEEADAADTKPADTVESLRIRVFRLLADGSPMELTTTLQLAVGGKERRLVLDRILPANSRPVSMSSSLAGRLDAKGGMELTLRPGTWQVEVKSALQGTPKFLSASDAPYPWPRNEVWSFRESPAFRALSLEGAPSVDPGQAGVDPSDRDLPAWSLDRDHSLSVQVTRSGFLDPDSQTLSLSRKIWIDADGHGATIRDGLGVRTAHPMRLSILPPFEAGRIVVDNAARLITTSQPGERGVNLPAGQRAVEVLGRIPDGKWHEFAVSNNGIRLEQASIEVQAPPGWWILHLSGPSGSVESSTWLAHWNLEECLWSAIIVGLYFFALGRIGGLLALGICLTGAHDRIAIEPWFALGLILTARRAVVRFLPRFEQQLRTAVPAILVVLVWCGWSCLGFSADQWTRIVHPSVRIATDEGSLGGILRGNISLSKDATTPPSEQIMALQAEPRPSIYGEAATETRSVAPPPSSPSGMMRSSTIDRIMTSSDDLLGEDVDPDQSGTIDAILAGKKGDGGTRTASFGGIGLGTGGRSGGVSAGTALPKPTAKEPISVIEAVRDPFLEGSIQTGPGIPNSIGPTSRLECPSWPALDARVGIWTASVGWVRSIRLLGLCLCWSLLVAAYRSIGRSRNTLPLSVKAMPLGLFLLLLPAATRAQTAFPDESMLRELKAKLTRPPSCGTDCADISTVRIVARGSEIQAQVTIQALAKTSIWLPRGDWNLTGIRCETCTVGAQGADPWVIVDKGIHVATMTARSSSNDLVVSFPVRPRVLEFDVPGWTRQDDGRGSAHLVKRGVESGTSGLEDAAAPSLERPKQNPGAVPYVRIEREFQFSHEWTVTTRVTRASQLDGAIAVSYPLVAGEILLDGQGQDSGKAHWVVPAKTGSVVFRSKLRHDDTLVLKASDGPWSESWYATALDRLQIIAIGLAPVGNGDLRWYPFPGDELRLSPKAHPAAKGPVATIQNAVLNWTDDPRSCRGSLDVQPEASQAAELKVKLPEDSRLGQVLSNGRIVAPTRLPDGRWMLPLTTRTNAVHLEWVSEPDRSFLRRAPSVELSIPGANFRTSMRPGTDRFAVASGGDGNGVRTAWWFFLPFFVIAALAVSRATRGRLAIGTALALAIPFTTVSGAFHRVGLLSIALLFFVLRWRGRQDTSSWTRRRFFFVQLEICVVAAIAFWSFVQLLLVPLRGAPDFWMLDSNGPWTWIVDRSNGALPGAWIFELPVWTWKAAMGLWSLYVLKTAIPWIRAGWDAFGRGGFWPPMNDSIENGVPDRTPVEPGEEPDSQDHPRVG